MEWGYDEIRAPPYQGKVLASPPVKMPNRIPWKAISDALLGTCFLYISTNSNLALRRYFCKNKQLFPSRPMLTFWRFELLRSSTNGKKTIFCLIQSAMPGRTIREANPAPARGVLRWGNEERLLLHRLFRLHETSPNDGDAMDASRIHDVVYLGTVHQRHPLFR